MWGNPHQTSIWYYANLWSYHWKTGGITNTFLPPSSTSLEEETAIDLNVNDIDDCDILHLDNNDLASLPEEDLSIQDEPTTAIDPHPPSPCRSNRVRKVNNNYDESEWVSLAKEIKEEEIPWSHYGDPALFIPKIKEKWSNYIQSLGQSYQIWT